MQAEREQTRTNSISHNYSIKGILLVYIYLLYTYTESSNLIGPLPLNNFSYSTPTIAHAHKVIKCQFEENLVGNGSG